MTSTVETAAGSALHPPTDPRRFRALAVIAVAQLMVVLDASVVIIALPSAQRALHISTANRQWMLTAYTLAFAGLLLLGGRIADYFGRKRMFVVSLIGFAAASALGGLAQNSAMLFSARALQGAFAAVMAPAALSLITVAFTEPKERARAFGVYGAIAGSGSAIGLILGGVLTEFASWRWTLLINVPIAVVTAVAATRVRLRESQPLQPRLRPAGRRHGDRRAPRPRLRLHQGGHGRMGILGHPQPLRHRRHPAACLRRHGAPRHPPTPAHPRRARPQPGRVLPLIAAGGDGMLGTFLSLTYYFQGTLHYSAMKSGFAFVPFSVGVVSGATIASRLLPRFGPRLLMTGGMVTSGIGLVLFTHPDDPLVVRPRRDAGHGPGQPGHGSGLRPMSSTALIGVRSR